MIVILYNSINIWQELRWTWSGGGHGNPLQYSYLEIPWTEEPGRLQSTGWQGVRHDSASKPPPPDEFGVGNNWIAYLYKFI